MNRYSLTHVPDPALLRELRTLLSRERVTTAALLAHLAEVDARRLYAAAGHPSMFAWCVEELHLSEDAAFKRIRAAWTARQFPAIYGLLADGRLHLTAVVFLTPYLTPENAGELLAAATRRSKAGIEQLLAERFPRPDLPARIEALAPSPAFGELVPEPVESLGPGVSQLVPEPVGSPPLGTVDFSPADFLPPPVTVAAKVAPLAPGRYGLQLTVAQGTYDKLRYAQALLGHAASSGELAEVLDRALDALIARLEQRKFAATTRPRRRQPHTGENPRHIPVAQHAAREARARAAADEAQARAAAAAEEARARAATEEVVPWLRALGLRLDEARRAAASCEAIPDAPLEERVRCALSGLGRPARGRVVAVPRPAP